MSTPKHAWMVRAGIDNELADLVESENIVAMGWDTIGDLAELQTREEFKECYGEMYPDSSLRRISINAGQFYRFAREIREGDYVLTYIKSSREVLIGQVVGPYEYRSEAYLDRYPYVRRVQWLKRVSRDDFGARARKSMGSALTIFQVNNYLEEIRRLAAGQN